jgi:hypothetical protein
MSNIEVLKANILEEVKDLTVEELKCLVVNLKLKNEKAEKCIADIYIKSSRTIEPLSQKSKAIKDVS